MNSRLCIALSLAFHAACGGPQPAGYAPGLGEIMALQQVRHTKLWLAGAAANWELAAYETDELEEGFADAMRFHARHKSSPQPLTQAIPTYMDPPLADLRRAIEAKDQGRFEKAFDTFTLGCNGCHAATQFAFNVVVRPQQNPFPNQVFALPK